MKNSKILENTEEGIYKGLKEIIQKPYRNKEFSSNYNNLNRLKRYNRFYRRIKMRISVLTPTYNRGKLLNRLYYSLVKNLKFGIEIEWLIMDDGSTDETENIVKEFKEASNLEIKYYKQNNQGKMAAINNLVEHVTGQYMIDCDSDDYFADNSF